MTLRSETLREIVCDAMIANGGVAKPSEMCKTFVMTDASNTVQVSCVCDEGHTVQFNELFAMRRNNRNRQPDGGVCDIQHTVHSDELFVIRQHKRKS